MMDSLFRDGVVRIVAAKLSLRWRSERWRVNDAGDIMSGLGVIWSLGRWEEEEEMRI